MFLQNFLKLLSITGSLIPWTLLVWQLSVTWDTNPQYSHGYIIPFLPLSLIKSPPPVTLNGFSPGKAIPSSGKHLIIGLPALIASTLWIIREQILIEINKFCSFPCNQCPNNFMGL